MQEHERKQRTEAVESARLIQQQHKVKNSHPLLIAVAALILMDVCFSWDLAHRDSSNPVSVDERASKLKDEFVQAVRDSSETELEDGIFEGPRAPRLRRGSKQKKQKTRRVEESSGFIGPVVDEGVHSDEDADVPKARTTGVAHIRKKLKKEAKALSSFQFKYYIYGDERIAQQNIIRQLKQRPKGEDCNSDYFVNVRRDADAEILVLDALRKHELRVQRPEMGETIIIPVSAASIITWFGPDTNQTRATFDTVFQTLFGSAWFQSFEGNDHIMLSLETQMFSQVRRRKLEIHGLAQYYGALQNVTIANDMDWHGCRKLISQKKHTDFTEYFRQVKPPESLYGFSVGLLPADDVPFIEATYEKFQNATNFLFYWTKTRFNRDSDLYRLAILEDEIISKLPPSSIGIETNRSNWLGDFQDSKFCLVIRGDTPHSHALMRSVKVGCIPVVVSDTYATYAPTFKSTLDMEDYVIFIKERAFLRDPLGELTKLLYISEEELRTKLLAIAFAQRVSIPDHPSSLFVPAFLKEAKNAMRKPIIAPSAAASNT